MLESARSGFPVATALLLMATSFAPIATAGPIAFTPNSLEFTVFSCAVAGVGACNNFTQNNLIIDPIGPNNGSAAIVKAGGFRFTGGGNMPGVVTFVADAASVGKQITIVMNGKRNVSYLANETLQLQSALDMDVSDPDGWTINYSMQTNFSVGLMMGFASITNGSINLSGHVGAGPNTGNKVTVNANGSGDLLGFFTASFTPTLVTGNPVRFSFSSSADAMITSDIPEPDTFRMFGIVAAAAAIARTRHSYRRRGSVKT